MRPCGILTRDDKGTSENKNIRVQTSGMEKQKTWRGMDEQKELQETEDDKDKCTRRPKFVDFFIIFNHS